jgi:4-amino-4-deoxy-L-arabinose transferase-like glycosyltransferase
MSRNVRAALVIAAQATVLRFLFSAWLPLTPDEAYYWQWSRTLAAGYFDHPPMVAWLIAASTAIFGSAEWAIRLPAVLGMAALTAFGWRVARREADEQTALKLVVALSVVPLTHLGGVIITPDTPLVLCWALLLAATHAALERPGYRAFLLVGIALGLGILSKLTMLLAVPVLLLLVWLHGDFRQKRGLMGAFGIALLIASPFLFWCNQHGWQPVLFQLAHISDTSQSGFEDFSGFLLAQIALLTPGFAWLLWQLFRKRATLPAEQRRLLPFIWLPLGVSVVIAAVTHAEAGWAAVAYLAALWLIVMQARLGGVLSPRLLRTASVLALMFTSLLYLWASGLIGPQAPTRSAFRLQSAAASFLPRLTSSQIQLPVFAQNYRLAALWSYYVSPDRAAVPVWPGQGQRASQSDATAGKNVENGFIWIAEARARTRPVGVDASPLDCFFSDEREPALSVKSGFVFWICENENAGADGPRE